jgi:hypothetical protein
MIVSAAKQHAPQGVIWDWVGDTPLTTVAQARPYVGDFFEEATRVLFGGNRHQYNANADYCPDISVAPKRFLEVKSIGKSNSGIVFADRVDRDRQLIREGNTLTYIFWTHSVNVQDYKTLFALRDALAKQAHSVYVIPFNALHSAIKKLPKVQILATETQKRMGYRLPLKLLQSLVSSKVTERPGVKVYGAKTTSIDVMGQINLCYPDLTKEEIAAANQLHFEMCTETHQVGLREADTPKYNGHMVRVVWSKNPSWYRKLCLSETRRRKVPRKKRVHDTNIRRYAVMGALERFMAGRLPTYKYDFAVLDIVKSAAEQTRKEY